MSRNWLQRQLCHSERSWLEHGAQWLHTIQTACNMLSPSPNLVGQVEACSEGLAKAVYWSSIDTHGIRKEVNGLLQFLNVGLVSVCVCGGGGGGGGGGQSWLPPRGDPGNAVNTAAKADSSSFERVKRVSVLKGSFPCLKLVT